MFYLSEIKQTTYTIHALLSKVMRYRNIPGNIKQTNKKDNANSKETPRYSESAQIQHGRLWDKAEKPCLIWAAPQLSPGLELMCSGSMLHLSKSCWSLGLLSQWFEPSPSHVYEIQLCQSHRWPHNQCGGHSTGPPHLPWETQVSSGPHLL